LAVCKNDILQAFELLVACYKNGGKILACGNGGSAADAEHIVGELMNKFNFKRALFSKDIAKINATLTEGKEFLLEHLQPAIPAISLTAQAALTTAIANDVSAEMIFAQQVYGYGKPGDVLFAITTSGNSKNILHAIHVAKIFGLAVVCLTGKTGGKAAKFNCDVLIRVPEEVSYKIQSGHLAVYHTLCAMLEAELFG